jgi:hypothetical protein
VNAHCIEQPRQAHDRGRSPISVELTLIVRGAEAHRLAPSAVTIHQLMNN